MKTSDAKTDRPEWGVLTTSGEIRPKRDYDEAEYAVALANDEDYGSASLVRFYDPDGSGSRWVIWYSTTGEWSPIETPTKTARVVFLNVTTADGELLERIEVALTDDRRHPLGTRFAVAALVDEIEAAASIVIAREESR